MAKSGKDRSISTGDFVPDSPWTPAAAKGELTQPTSIAGLTVKRLIQRSDSRGSLAELLTIRDGLADPIVHVYQVHAEPQSIRGWVFHRWQDDRLAYTEGKFRLALYDLRDDSKTKGALDVLEVGADNPCLVTIPKLVAHAVKNEGNVRSCFVNMPTRAYDPAHPDKCRLAYPDPRIPFTF